MPTIYTVTRNTPRAKDSNGNVYHTIGLKTMGGDKEPTRPYEINNKWVLSTDEQASWPVGAKVEITYRLL